MTTTATITEPMSAEQAARLADFARTCKAAIRAVSLYPGAHPAIAASLHRLATATAALAAAGEVHLVVHPNAIHVGDRAAVRPDASIAELADLLHSRLIGALRVSAGADSEDWRRLLLLLSSSVDELLAEGGITKAWAATGRSHFEIEEIDYASVLKERTSGSSATWDQVLAFCLKGESVALDDGVIDMLLTALEDASAFGNLLEQLHEKAEAEGASLPARMAALFRLLQAALEAADARGSTTRQDILDTVAEAAPHLTPDMILALVAQRESPRPQDAELASGVLDRMTDASVASFVARTVTMERGASARLAHAFEALVPDQARRPALLDLAQVEAKSSDAGQDPRFEDLWQGATKVMLATYSDEGFVSADYARELTAARTQALDVERTSDDPPERIAAWLGTINERAIRELDLNLTLDLLRLEDDPAAWESIARVAATETERRVLTGDLPAAQRLVESLTAEGTGPRTTLHEPAQRAIATLARGAFPRHVATHLRKANEHDVTALAGICQAVGPAMVGPLAETLAAEDHVQTIRRLKDILVTFGAAGRQAIQPLKNSTNPAVRRTAIDLLRVFGGNEALRELTTMLADSDPQVQQDAVKAIVQIGTREAYAVLEDACQGSPAARDRIVEELVSLRDAKAIPPLCFVLTTTEPNGSVAGLHEAIIEALASLRAHPDSTAALRTALHRGTWWAPVRTARLRQAAAQGLRRLGSNDARAALEDATRTGSRGVRKVAGTELASMTPAGARP